MIYRPFVAPPGTPAETMKILRDAFGKAVKDKELLAEAKKTDLPIDFVAAEDAVKVVVGVLRQPPEMAEEIAKYIKFGD
jgi:tripartite-type tricarboxylate transporter receptor subunit TctC